MNLSTTNFQKGIKDIYNKNKIIETIKQKLNNDMREHEDEDNMKTLAA